MDLPVTIIPIDPGVERSRVHRGPVAFEELPPDPHPHFDHSVLRFRVQVPATRAPLGTIIRITRTNDEGSRPWWQWVYLPENEADPAFADSSSIDRIRRRIREFHRSTRRSVVRGDLDDFEWEAVRWSGHRAAWSELDGKFSFTDDVLRHCPSADLVSQSWDADAPGRSGVFYRLFTPDATKLRNEIATRIQELKTTHGTALDSHPTTPSRPKRTRGVKPSRRRRHLP